MKLTCQFRRFLARTFIDPWELELVCKNMKVWLVKGRVVDCNLSRPSGLVMQNVAWPNKKSWRGAQGPPLSRVFPYRLPNGWSDVSSDGSDVQHQRGRSHVPYHHARCIRNVCDKKIHLRLAQTCDSAEPVIQGLRPAKRSQSPVCPVQ